MSREIFSRELAIGTKWAKEVAKYLTEQGFPAEASDVGVTDDPVMRQHLTENDQDITFLDRPGCLEVKSRRLTFHYNPSTYPYETAFVDTVSGWDQKVEKPLGVVLVSQITGKMMVIPPESRPHWETKTTFDRVRGFTDTWYIVNKKHMIRMDEFLGRLRNDVRA